jgi:hypothetical protein
VVTGCLALPIFLADPHRKVRIRFSSCDPILSTYRLSCPRVVVSTPPGIMPKGRRSRAADATDYKSIIQRSYAEIARVPSVSAEVQSAILFQSKTLRPQCLRLAVSFYDLFEHAYYLGVWDRDGLLDIKCLPSSKHSKFGTNGRRGAHQP